MCRGSTAVHRTIGEAHQGSRGNTATVLAGISRIAAGMDTDTIDRWVKFAAPSVTPQALDVVLRSPEYEAWALALSLTDQTQGPL
jgi:hypothetical protein